MKQVLMLLFSLAFLSGFTNAQTPFWGQPTLTTEDVRDLVVASQDIIFAGTSEHGVYRSTDQGVSWTIDNEGIPPSNTPSGFISISALAVDPSLGFLAFVGTSNGLYSKFVSDSFWYRYTPDTLELLYVFVIKVRSYVDETGIIPADDIIIGTDRGILRSTSEVSNWTELNSGRTDVLSLAVDSNGILFAGTAEGGVFRSTDDGGTWNAVNNGLENLNILSLEITPHGHLLAGTSGGSRIYRSTDGGESWTASNAGITSGSVRAICIARFGEIFAGVNGAGVFRSTDDGNSWNAINSGLTNLKITSLAIDSSGYLYAGAGTLGGSGIYRSNQVVTEVNSLGTARITTFQLEQNYPNPFNPSTTIRFTLPKEEYVSLKVYDLLGKEVATLVSNRLQVGSHSVQWDAREVPSGVYFYRLKTGDYLHTKKLILLK